MQLKSTLLTFFNLLTVSTLFFTFGCQGKKDPIDTNRPKETISIERARKMLESYQDRYASLTELREGKEDSRYGWHSLEFYENYIAYLKHESAKIGIKVSGIRLYYAAYPEDDRSGKQAGYQTYLYVPTYYNEELGQHVAFDPLHVDDAGRPVPLHQVITEGLPLAEKQSAAIMATFNEETLSSIANMGEMCPLNCPEEDGASGIN